jgi:hypothetical protein
MAVSANVLVSTAASAALAPDDFAKRVTDMMSLLQSAGWGMSDPALGEF